MNTIHICIIKRKFRDTGGIKNKIIEEVRLCNELGYEPYILVETEQGHLEGLRYQVVKFGLPFKSRLFSWVFKSQVRHWIKKYRPKLIISHNDIACDGIVHVHNCVHLHHEKVHGTPISENNRHAKEHNKIYSNRNCRLFIANSRITKNDLIARHGVPPENIAVVYPELDLNKFNPDNHEQRRAAGRKMLGLSSDDTAIGLVTSGDFAKRNVSFYLDIVSELLKHQPQLKAVLIGKDKFDSYKKKAASLGILNNMIFQSVVPDVENVYHALDVTLLPAHHEEFGYVVTESMACGTPCLVSEGVGAGELYMDNNMSQMVLPLGDPKQWAEKVLNLLEKNESRQAIIRKSIQLSQQYTEENSALYKKIIRDIIAEKSR